MKKKKQFFMSLLILLVGLPTLSAQSKQEKKDRNDSVISYLLYFGQGYSIPYGGGNGLNFRVSIKEYDMKMDKKGNTVIEFIARNPEDRYEFRAKVYPNGEASINVNMQSRQSISFQGELEMEEQPYSSPSSPPFNIGRQI